MTDDEFLRQQGITPEPINRLAYAPPPAPRLTRAQRIKALAAENTALKHSLDRARLSRNLAFFAVAAMGVLYWATFGSR